MLIAALAFVFVFLVIWPIFIRISVYRILWSKHILFKDEANSRAFFDKEYAISGKPDRITRHKGKVYSIEYKSRGKGIYKRDIIEAISAAIAAYDAVGGVDFVLIYNSSHQHKLIKVRSKSKLFALVKAYAHAAVRIKYEPSYRPKKKLGNCPVCPYSETCKK